MIARCPDYYGPGGGHSTLYETVVSRLMKRQDALWLGNMLARHSLAYTVDAGKAMATLALDETAYNQVRHPAVRIHRSRCGEGREVMSGEKLCWLGISEQTRK